MNNTNTSRWLETIVNRYLRLDPEGLAKLAELKGKVVCVDVLSIDQQYYIFPDENHVSIKTSHDTGADTTIRGTPAALLKLGLQSDTAPLMLSGEIEISGDVRLGRKFKKTLAELDIDWEEHLSHLVGDVPANLVFNVLGKISSWSKKTVSSISADLSEYLQEESRDVVTGVELGGFNDKVDQLRDDVDRLAALIRSKSH